MRENATPLEYRTARWHCFMLIAFAGLWAWAGLPFLDDEPWIPILAFTFAAASLYVGVTNLLHPAIVRFEPEGLRFRHWRMAWFVPWTDIADVWLFTIRISGVTTQRNVMVRDRDGVDRRISSGLTISQERLLELIRLRCDMS